MSIWDADDAEDRTMCIASQSSITMAMERSAAFLREAERERRLCAAEIRSAPPSGLAAGWRARWRQALVALAPAVGSGRAAPATHPS